MRWCQRNTLLEAEKDGGQEADQHLHQSRVINTQINTVATEIILPGLSEIMKIMMQDTRREVAKNPMMVQGDDDGFVRRFKATLSITEEESIS